MVKINSTCAPLTLLFILLVFIGRHHPQPTTHSKVIGARMPQAVASLAAAGATVPPRSPDNPPAAFAAAHEAGEFRSWWRSVGAAPAPGQIREGAGLLRRRRGALLTLLRENPKQAWAHALTFAEQERLPAEWRPLVEERFSAVAEVQISPHCGGQGAGGGADLMITMDGGAVLRSQAWGAWRTACSKKALPVEGIALEGWAVLADNGVRPVNGPEAEAVIRRFPVAPSTSPEEGTMTALVGGMVHHWKDQSVWRVWADLYGEVLALPGPKSAGPLVKALVEGAAMEPKQVRRYAMLEASSWTETPKSVLVLNTVFSDRPTPLGTQAEWKTVMEEVSSWLAANSYGKTRLTVTVPSNVLVLPSPGTVYEPSELYQQLMQDAKASAAAAGFDSASFDITVVAFPGLNWFWRGRGTLGGGNHWLNGTRNPAVIAHEFGHNYGLRHASSWDTNDGTVLPATGVPGTSDPRHREYGDSYSVMGDSGSYPQGDFSQQGKATLNWITAGQVKTVTAPGTYRIHRFDHAGASGEPMLALKLQRESSQTFWIGYRRNFTPNAHMSNGAYALWEYTPGGTRLLDMTPDSRSEEFSDKEDAALAIGWTFTDPTGYLYVTPVAQGGTAPYEWLDVRVEFTIAGNRPPTAAVQSPAGPLAARVPITLTASGQDPDGDTLTFAWDFGNGRTATGTTVQWTFSAGGTRMVILRVTDGKGGVATQTLSLPVADPLAEWESVPGSEDHAFLDAIVHKGMHVGTAYWQSGLSADGIQWRTQRHELGYSRRRLAAGPLGIVAVGGYYEDETSSWRGMISASADGVIWKTIQPPAQPGLNSVVCWRGAFYAVGKTGTILSSPDGKAWTARTTNLVDDLRDITATTEGLVACGGNGVILTSPDGVNWERHAVPNTLLWLSSLATDGLRVAAVGNADFFWWSVDGGLSWESRNFLLENFNPVRIIHADGLWIAASSDFNPVDSTWNTTCAVSVDGSNWDLLPPLMEGADGYFENMRFQDGRVWFYGYDGKILHSGLVHADNIRPSLTVKWPPALAARTPADFTTATTDADADPVTVLWESAGRFYPVGSPASIQFGIGGGRMVTAWASDGRGGRISESREYLVDDRLLYWTDITPPSLSSEEFRYAARSSSRAVAVGGYSSATAPVSGLTNGMAWKEGILQFDGHGIAWRETGGFVVAGYFYNSSTASWKSRVCRSVDGLTWSAPQAVEGTGLNAVAASDSAYVAVGEDGVILRSVDGVVWSTRPSGVTDSLVSVAFAGSRGLAVGYSVILNSEDGGVTWTNSSVALPFSFARRVFTVAERLFVEGYNELWVYEPGMGRWIQCSIDLERFGNLQSLVRHSGLYIAITLKHDSASGIDHRGLLVSEDGLIWEGAEPAWSRSLYALISSGADLVAVGDNAIAANTVGTPGLVLNSAILSVSRASIESGALGGVMIANSGPGILAWSVSSSVPWMAAVPASGSASFQPSVVSVRQLASLPAGTHAGTLTFSAPGLPSRTVTVSVVSYTDDFGNSAESASPGTPGSEVAGRIQSDADSDWFVFMFDRPGRFTAWTTGNLDTLAELRDQAGYLTRSDDSNDDLNFRIEWEVLPGAYWLKVEGFDIGNYLLHSSFVPTGGPFAIRDWTLIAGQYRFTVATTPGYQYHVQTSTDPSVGWAQWGTEVTASGAETILTANVPAGAVRRYFRIGMKAP
ncbi:MAG: hypothetical protein JWM59_3118 [Verrucomicrobiales bacterium]|nr:hypothetical protein [Verrucomicrobiales bacterium]